MLRFMYIMLDILGSIMALLSPVCIIHWLIETTPQTQGIAPFVQPLDILFAPLNEMFRPLFEMGLAGLNGVLFKPLLGVMSGVLMATPLAGKVPSEIPYIISTSDGTQVPITQGILGFVFTLVFFACSAGSQMLKAAEQRIDVTQKDFQQRRRLQQLQSQQQKKEKKAVTNRALMVYIHCNFQENPTSTAYFEDLYPKYGGHAQEITPDSMLIEFKTLEGSLKYCIEAAQQVLRYYATLRPMDSQPPFHVGIHAYEVGSSHEKGLRWCRQLIRYAGDNQMVFSPSVKDMMSALGQMQMFKFQPQGYYQFDDGGVQEIYRLTIR